MGSRACRLFNCEEESSIHILAECTTLSRRRCSFLGKMLDFVRELGLIEELLDQKGPNRSKESQCRFPHHNNIIHIHLIHRHLIKKIHNTRVNFYLLLDGKSNWNFHSFQNIQICKWKVIFMITSFYFFASRYRLLDREESISFLKIQKLKSSV